MSSFMFANMINVYSFVCFFTRFAKILLCIFRTKNDCGCLFVLFLPLLLRWWHETVCNTFHKQYHTGDINRIFHLSNLWHSKLPTPTPSAYLGGVGVGVWESNLIYWSIPIQFRMCFDPIKGSIFLSFISLSPQPFYRRLSICPLHLIGIIFYCTLGCVWVCTFAKPSVDYNVYVRAHMSVCVLVGFIRLIPIKADENKKKTLSDGILIHSWNESFLKDIMYKNEVEENEIEKKRAIILICMMYMGCVRTVGCHYRHEQQQQRKTPHEYFSPFAFIFQSVHILYFIQM